VVTVTTTRLKKFFPVTEKYERVKKKIYGTWEEARSDIFDHIEMFYSSKRLYGLSAQMSMAEY